MRTWVKTRERNEILDLWVYNLAALEILNPRLGKLVAELEARVQANDEQEALKASEPDEKTDPADRAAGRKKRQRIKPKRRGGFVNSWKK